MSATGLVNPSFRGIIGYSVLFEALVACMALLNGQRGCSDKIRETLLMPDADLEAYEDIPGTYLFNRHRSRQGYHLNQCFMSLLKAQNREKFLADERAYLEAWGNLSEPQIEAVLARDWLGMVKQGGNIYYMAKLIGTDQRTFQYVAGAMAGASEEQYRKMMAAGGRPVEGNRSKSEWKKGEES